MSNAEFYRKRAEDCMEIARLVRSRKRARALRRQADEYLSLAREAALGQTDTTIDCVRGHRGRRAKE
jgi:3-methyladenine DNA glycosylase Tag